MVSRMEPPPTLDAGMAANQASGTVKDAVETPCAMAISGPVKLPKIQTAVWRRLARFALLIVRTDDTVPVTAPVAEPVEAL